MLSGGVPTPYLNILLEFAYPPTIKIFFNTQANILHRKCSFFSYKDDILHRSGDVTISCSLEAA